MPAKILSIDLQSDLLTAALLSGDINRELLATTVIATQEKTIEEQIQQLVTDLDCNGSRCVLSLGASFFLFRTLSLPFSDRKSIEQILPLQLKGSIALPLESILFDTVIINRENGGSEVITAMIQQSVLAAYHTALKQGNIIPERITVSGIPTLAEITGTGQAPEEFIFLDLHLETTTLFFVSSGKPLIIRTIDTALQAESFHKLARTVKQTLAPLSLKTPYNRLPIYIDGTICHTPKIIPLLESSAAFARPCLLCGKAGLLPLPVQMVQKAKKHAPFMVACLALGKQADKLDNTFNFARGAFSFRDSFSEYRNKAGVIGFSLLAIIISSLCYLVYDTASLKKQRAELVSDIHTIFHAALPDVQRIVAPVQQLETAIQNEKNAATDGKSHGLPQTTLFVLRELSLRIPVSLEVRLMRMVYEKKSLRLIGSANSFNTVNSVQKNLERSPVFQKVTIRSTKQNPKDNTIHFELIIETKRGAQ